MSVLLPLPHSGFFVLFLRIASRTRKSGPVAGNHLEPPKGAKPVEGAGKKGERRCAGGRRAAGLLAAWARGCAGGRSAF